MYTNVSKKMYHCGGSCLELTWRYLRDPLDMPALCMHYKVPSSCLRADLRSTYTNHVLGLRFQALPAGVMQDERDMKDDLIGRSFCTLVCGPIPLWRSLRCFNKCLMLTGKAKCYLSSTRI